MAALLDGERTTLRDHKGSVAAADRLPPQKRQSALGPIRTDGGLVIPAVAMRSAEIGPISTERLLLGLLRTRRGGLDHGRNTLARAIALQLRLMRDPILKCRER